MLSCRQVVVFVERAIETLVTMVTTKIDQVCQNVTKEIETWETRWEQQWVQETSRVCQSMPWPLSALCSWVTAWVQKLVQVVVKVIKTIVEVVCTTVTSVVTTVLRVIKVVLVAVIELVCSLVGSPTPGHLGMPPLAPGSNSVRNLVDGSNVLPVLLDDLKAARSSINISMFLFFDDPISREVADVLIAKAGNRDLSVNVRVMMDFDKTQMGDPFSTSEKGMMDKDPSFVGNALDVRALAKRLRAAGVEVLNTNIDYDKVVPTANRKYADDAAAIRRVVLVDSWHVDHRKIITIDGRVGYCGSANIGAQYLYHRPFDPAVEAHQEADAIRAAREPEPWWKWHDGLARFEGPVVNVFEEVFKERWVLNGGRDFVATPPSPSQNGPFVRSLEVVASQPGFPNDILALFLRMISGARSEIFLEHAYLFHPRIVDALLAAKRRNPDLRLILILPTRDTNDNPLCQDAQEFRYQRYVPAGIEVFEYQNHFNHLKIATFDGRFSILGSTNLNYRSLEDDKDFEMVVLVDDGALAADINAAVRDRDTGFSKRITAADLSFRTNTRNPATWAAEKVREL